MPGAALRELVLSSLRRYGATEAGELVRAVSRQLGFGHVGPRIQGRLEECIEELLGAEQLGRTADGRLQAASGLAGDPAAGKIHRREPETEVRGL